MTVSTHSAWRRLALLCLLTLTIATVTTANSSNNNNDDRNLNWGVPSKNNKKTSRSKTDKNNHKSSKRKSQPKKGKNKDLPDDNDDGDGDDDDDSSNPIKASFTFFPQSDFNFNSLLENSQSMNEEKKQAMLSRLQDYVRERMIDHEEVDKQVNRSRKEWEDMNIEQHTKTIQAMMKIGSLLLKSPPMKTLMSSREAQESLRQFVLSIKLLLEDPEKEFVFGDSDRWHAMFDRLKKWEGASQDSLLEVLIEHLEERHDND